MLGTILYIKGLRIIDLDLINFKFFIIVILLLVFYAIIDLIKNTIKQRMFLNNLREREDILKFYNVKITDDFYLEEPTIEENYMTSSKVFNNSELMIGNDFIFLSYIKAILHKEKINEADISGMIWNIKVPDSNFKIYDNDSILILTDLPDEAYHVIIIKDILKNPNYRDEIISKLNLLE